MGEAHAGGQVLIASNRGPVSFTRGDDGRLSAKRGGGGMVSGLSAVADNADMLWVCAALSDDDRAAARLAPGGLLDPAQAGAGAAVRMLDIPPADLSPRLQRGRELHVVVRAPHAVRHAQPAQLRTELRA